MLYAVEDQPGEESGAHIFCVGIKYDDGTFAALADFETEILAYAFVNYLNGGEGEVFAEFKK